MEKMKFMRALWKKYPRKYQMEHDFIGLSIGKLPDEINKVLVCLDFDEFLLPTVDEFRPDVILTHHPFIYGKRKEVLESDPKKKELTDILENDYKTCIVSLHTNFDSAPGGMNDALCDKLELINVYSNPINPMMRVGYLETPMAIEAFISYFLNKTGLTYGTFIHGGSDTIYKLGIIAGGGSGYFKDAQLEDCDIYISGDCPHHVRREITRYHMNYLDVPHEIERIFIPTMTEFLSNLDPNLTIVECDHEEEPNIYLMS